MNKLFGSLIVQFREFYKTLTPTKRMALIVASIMVFVTAIVMVSMVTGRSYSPLFRKIPPDQLPIVLNSLRTKNIPFQLENDGATVLIPSELLHSTQMAVMAESGSEQIGNIGMELFDKQDFGTTSYVQRVNYQRALQGELVRAINTLSSVKKSKVLLAMPAKKTFLEEGGKPKASVVVELHPGKRLTSDQVKGITFLVASSVEDMDAGNVSVVDARGKVLTKQYESGMGISNALIDMQKNMEGHIEERIESILARVVGAGKVIARVNVELNQQNTDVLEELYDGDKTAIRSVQSEEEKLDGSRTNPSGIPGSRANIPGAQDAGQVGFNQNVSKELKTTNFEVPKTVRKVRESAGSLEKVSVAVLVDGSYETVTKDDGTVEKTYQPRTEEELRQYENLVRNAIGFDATRGDLLKIENIPFEKEDFSESEKLLTTLERKKLLYSVFRWTALAGVIGIFFFLFIRPFMRWVTDSFQDSVEDMLPKTIEELEELQSMDNTLPGMQGALPVLEESIDPDKAESELLKERIMTMVETNEEKASNAFQLWMNRRDL